MKINLLYDNPKGLIKDYINVDYFVESYDGRNKGDLHNLDWVADTASVEYLIADNILCYFSFPDIHKILINWISKLKIGGKIIIRGVDFEEVCRDLILGKIDNLRALKLIYGEQDKPWNIYKSGFSINEIIAYLEEAGLKVTKKIFEDFEFVVEAERTA